MLDDLGPPEFANAEVVRELRLPRWMYLYALGRHAYAYMPTQLKRVVRRGMAGSQERDV